MRLISAHFLLFDYTFSIFSLLSSICLFVFLFLSFLFVFFVSHLWNWSNQKYPVEAVIELQFLLHYKTGNIFNSAVRSVACEMEGF